MAALEAQLVWSQAGIVHTDRLILPDNAFQADGRWAGAAASARREGETELDAAPWIEPAGLTVVTLPLSHCRMRARPVPGRFYPRLAFADLARGPRDMQPVRVVALEGDRLLADPNHPLAGASPRMAFRTTALEAVPSARVVDLFAGPGLQHPAADPAATYFGLEGFTREDEAGDAAFYAQPRLIHHLDAACRAALGGLYARFLFPGARVLDLMGSWASHLPAGIPDLHVAGLGMNGEELAANPILAERVVKDLNQRADLPWGDAVFDLVVCTASVEYLLRPREVMAEVLRVLKPGGRCVVSFSDRWFPPKAIRVWSELHPFERLGMVLALFRGAGFAGLGSETLRGVQRPEDDKYIGQRTYSDPLFAAWGGRPG